MALNGDPYRTLGLARGATLDEVKRAYRRLAKANHPDAAGIAALPRFLAIQAAYDQLTGETQNPAPATRRPAASAKRRPAADSDRADATRRAYGGRPKGSRPSSDNAEPGPGTSRPSRGANEAGATAGRAEAGPSEPGASGRGSAGRAGEPGAGTPGRRGKATLGSTSYDGADAGPFEPDWGGASWYGTTSGTYWTINPKEYADPRKHGPDYQARAKRASAGRPDPDPGPDATEPRRRPEPAHGDSGPTHTTSSWWDSTTGPVEPEGDPDAAPADAAPPAHRPRPTFREPGPDPARAAADLVRAIVDPAFGGFRGRIARAFVGWLPIALGLGWLFGELTGCGRFAATCDNSVAPLILVIQGGALVGLLLLPVVASLAASAALGLLAASVAATLVLSATGGAADEASRRATLGVLLVVAWGAGLSIAIGQRIRSASARSGPVS